MNFFPGSLLVYCAAFIFSGPAFADTVIDVKYDTKVKRLRPSPVEGTGGGKVKMILHENGKIDDVIESIGTKTRTDRNKNTRLGRTGSETTYKVIDKNTILRTFRSRTHTWEVKITVAGKICNADVKYTLLPGQTEFAIFSPSLGVLAYYSDVTPTNIQCSIQ